MPWTDTARVEHSRKFDRYPSDLQDREWALIEGLLPPAKRGGRPRTTDLREVMKPTFVEVHKLTARANMVLDRVEELDEDPVQALLVRGDALLVRIDGLLARTDATLGTAQKLLDGIERGEGLVERLELIDELPGVVLDAGQLEPPFDVSIAKVMGGA